MSFSLEGQTALVTGASRGIGAAIARTLAQAGATILLNYRSNREAAEKVLAELRAHAPKSELLPFDVANEGDVEKAIESVSTRFPSIEILVCNAGISKDVLFPRATGPVFQEVFSTNFFGSVYVSRVVSRMMMKARYGRIIFLSSVVGESGNKGQSPYAASKSALFGFAKSIALELGSRQITANVICPGFIETEMTEKLDEATKKQYLDKIASGRFGTAEEVAHLVRFLASKEAAYITGSTLDINGGLLMR